MQSAKDNARHTRGDLRESKGKYIIIFTQNTDSNDLMQDLIHIKKKKKGKVGGAMHKHPIVRTTRPRPSATL